MPLDVRPNRFKSRQRRARGCTHRCAVGPREAMTCTSAADRLMETARHDRIRAHAIGGRDSLDGGEGNDKSGNEVPNFGFAGNDTQIGGPGIDVFLEVGMEMMSCGAAPAGPRQARSIQQSTYGRPAMRTTSSAAARTSCRRR
jgi:hypothetical protein